jgi:hypothetical protein
MVGQSKARYLDRALKRRELKKIGGYSARLVREAAIAATVAGDVGRLGVPDRHRRRSPDVAGNFVPEIEDFALRIADGIVRPGSELVLAAVRGPSVASALGGGLKAERWIGDHVDPGRRRRLARPENSHVFLALRAEPSEAVEKFKRRRFMAGGAFRPRPARFGEGSLLRAASMLRSSCSNKLPCCGRDDDARRRDEQQPRRRIE